MDCKSYEKLIQHQRTWSIQVYLGAASSTSSSLRSGSRPSAVGFGFGVEENIRVSPIRAPSVCSEMFGRATLEKTDTDRPFEEIAKEREAAMDIPRT